MEVEYPVTPPPQVRRASTFRARRILLGAGTIVFLAVLANILLATLPVASAVREDARNEKVTLVGHLGYFVDPTWLTLDLVEAEQASPADLTRVLFQIAEHERDGDRIRGVTLSRHGTAVFVLSGTDFREIGGAFHRGENPIYLVRTLPGHLRLPSGERAFSDWEGGLLEVLSHQMDDANAFAVEWVTGESHRR